MHMETSADARLSKQRAASGQPDGAAASGRGIFATIASAFQSVVDGAGRPSALTADAVTGAGLRAGTKEEGRPPLGDANSAPLESGNAATHVLRLI